MDFGNCYQTFKLDEPIAFDINKIQREGIFIKPNVEAEEWLSRHSNSKDEIETFEEDAASDIGIPSCSSGDVKPVPKVAALFSGLRLNTSKELEPILDGGNDDEWSPLTPYRKLEQMFANVTDLGELKKKIERVGNGIKLPIQAVVWVDYEMWGDGMDEVIYRTQRPFKFRFFQPDVMPWFDLGVSTMEQFETSWFLVQPELGFKEVGIAGLVPPDTKLLFKIHVRKFSDTGVPGLTKLPQEDLQCFKYREIKVCVNELKERANAYLRRKDPYWRHAYDLYRKAAHFLEKYFVMDYSLQEDIYLNIFNLHNNMALCSIKLEMYERAIYHSEKALQTPAMAHSNLPKLFYRRAIAEFEMGHTESALDFILKAKRDSCLNNEINKMEKLIREKLKSEDAVQKKLFKRMTSVPTTGKY